MYKIYGILRENGDGIISLIFAAIYNLLSKVIFKVIKLNEEDCSNYIIIFT